MRGRLASFGVAFLTFSLVANPLVSASPARSATSQAARVSSPAPDRVTGHAAAGGSVRDRKMPKPAHSTTVKVTFAASADASARPSGGIGASDLPRASRVPHAAATLSSPIAVCPAIGADSGCGDLIVANDSGAAVIADPSQGPYDGADDTLVGIINESSSPLSGIQLSSDTGAFAFDGDGICSGLYQPEPSGCPFGPTGYEGPNTSFASINATGTAGTVLFPSPLGPGASTYFSLEEALSATMVFAGGPSTGEAGGAQNPGEHSSNCSTWFPVNCATGEFWHTFTDFTVPGRGAALDLTRTYLSADAALDGPFGFGWTDSYAMFLSTDTSGAVTVHQENASDVTFIPNGLGGFTAPPRVLATLTQNSDGSFTYTRRTDHIRNVFSAAGALLSQSDLNGAATTLSYTGALLTSVTDPAGRALTLSYTGQHVTSVTDPMGRTQTYTYDAAGNLSSTTDPAGRTWNFGYDSNHLLTTITDPRGGTSTNTYNASGQVTAQTDPKGAKTTWAYSGNAASPGGGSTTITDPDGTATVEQYISLELTSETRGAGTATQAITSYTYDPASLGIASVTDANGNTASNSYDQDGNLTSTTDPLGRTNSYQYNALDEQTSVTSPLGETTHTQYDGAGNLTAVIDALGNTTNYAYADSTHPGDVTSETDPDGRVVSFTYDTQGDVSSVTQSPATGVSDTTSYTHDADGERLCEASATANTTHISCPAPGGAHVAGTTSWTYNADGQTTSVTDPDGQSTSSTFDNDGNTTATTDADGNTTSYTYDADNELTATQYPDATVAETTYDPAGHTLTTTDALGDTTGYSYDALGRVNTLTDALGRATNYGYDPMGDPTTVTDPSGRTTTTGYDAAEEPVSVTYSDGSTPNVVYTYDADGQRASMTDGSGTTSYTYDTDMRLTATTDGAGAHVGYTYDPAGQITGLAYPNGQGVTRSYDGTGRLASVRDWLGNTTTFGYNADNALTSVSYPNGVTATAAYDAADQLTAIVDTHNAATLASYAYTRDHNGQLTGDQESGAPAASGTAKITYSYTALNQLGSTNAAPYTYSKAGSPTTLGNGTTQLFDPAGQMTSSTVPITAPPPSSTPTIDKSVNAIETSRNAPITAPPLTTTASGELLLAFVSADGPNTAHQQVTKVTGGGLTWTLVARANAVTGAGTAEVWQTHATTPLNAVTVSAALKYSNYDGAITVAAYTGAASALGAHATGGNRTGNPTLPITTTAAGSIAVAAGHNWSHATTETPSAGQSILTQNLDTHANDTYWTQSTAAIAQPATKVTLGDTSPLGGRWEMAAVEIPPGATGSSGGATTTATTAYGYDKQGNRTTITPPTGPATTLAYDQADRLTHYGTSTTYAYNGDGVRTAKTVNGTTTPFAWDLSGHLPMLLSDGTNAYIYGPGGQPIEQITGTTPAYLLSDQQSNTRLITDATGAVTGTYSYDAYGVTTAHTGTATTALRFNGQYADAETGYVYLRARYYDPATAQFLTVDPLTPATGNPYNYATDNPLNTGDPSGRNGVSDFFSTAWHSAGNVLSTAAGDAGNLGAGAIDTLSGGLLRSTLQSLGADPCSGWYHGGQIAGFAGLLIPGVGEEEGTALVAGRTGLAGARELGLEGETLSGIDQAAKLRIDSLTGTASYRIPDALDASSLTEVKNVGNLSYTSQLQDFNLYAQQEGLNFNLIVRENTVLSGPLQALVDSGQITLIRSLPAR